MATRPARPARWSAEACEIVTVSSRVKPEFGSKRGSRARPLSITARMPGKVMLDSATLVASTMRRVPRSAGASAACCSASESSPWRGRMSRCSPLPAKEGSVGARRRASTESSPPTSPPRGEGSRCSSACCARAISRRPGRNTSTSPSVSSSAWRTTRASWCSALSCARSGGCSMRTGKLRPGLLMRGASSQATTRSPSSVADISSRRRSGRRVACTSSASAAPRSPARWRSWNSSKRIAPMPASSGSAWISRVRMPSVTTSTRVVALTFDSKRMR
ncbi:hypothetical protein RLIN73S_06717 [Rhodanobacter lindaniclasticus]